MEKMTTTEVLSEIRKLPLGDVRQVACQITNYLSEHEETVPAGDELERREDEFEQYLYASGKASHVATRNETDEEFDAFELITVEGEQLSETIIRERR